VRITINARVTLGDYWEEESVDKEVEIKTEHTDDPRLPWEQICAGLVQAAITERLEKAQQERATDA